MKRTKTLVVAVMGLLFAAASSHAALTTVNDIWGTGAPGNTEWNLYNTGSGSAPGNGVMEYLYGTGNFTRVNDASDIQWAGLSGGATFDAIYAGNSQALYTAGLGGTPTSLILSGGGSTGATPSRSGSPVIYTPITQPFLFMDNSGGVNWYSDPTLNSADGGKDHMVTFAVTGYLATAGVASTYTAFTDGPHYVIAFEDSANGDYDYNDLVVEVSGVAPVPEPTTVIAGALLLLPFGASTLRILRKNRVA
jgi:Domain of unknown function (DUF4114)